MRRLRCLYILLFCLMIGIASSQVPLSQHVNSIGNYILDSINNNILRNNIDEAETICDPADFAPGTDRVWKEGIDPSVYTWTPQTFSGFFYDPKNEVGTEMLTVSLRSPGRIIDSGDLRYSTLAQDTEFEFHEWGSYQVIGFMGDKYFAGYDEGVISDTNRSLTSDGQLRKVLVDSDNESTLITGSALPLEEGYELRIGQVGPEGNHINLSLAKDGVELDSKIVIPSSNPLDRASNYIYDVNAGSQKNLPIIAAHVQRIFTSTESSLATVDAIFQVSDSPVLIEEGEGYGIMKVESVGSDGVTMRNNGTINLVRGDTIDVMGNLRLDVADNARRLLTPIATRTG